MEVAYRLRCPDPRAILHLPDEILDAWIWFLNDRTDRLERIAERVAAQGGGASAIDPAVLESL